MQLAATPSDKCTSHKSVK